MREPIFRILVPRLYRELQNGKKKRDKEISK